MKKLSYKDVERKMTEWLHATYYDLKPDSEEDISDLLYAAFQRNNLLAFKESADILITTIPFLTGTPPVSFVNYFVKPVWEKEKEILETYSSSSPFGIYLDTLDFVDRFSIADCSPPRIHKDRVLMALRLLASKHWIALHQLLNKNEKKGLDERGVEAFLSTGGELIVYLFLSQIRVDTF